MLDKIKNRKESGFTIVEVMIVLAIAGLVILIVFLAVPALQRNSRNTQRKADVSGLLGAVNEFTSNNRGTNPTTAAQVVALANTGFYQGVGTAAGNIGDAALARGAQAALGNNAPNDRARIILAAKCGTNGATVAGPARSVAIQYLTETAAGFTPSCQEG